jgi:hypothetical protein
VDRTGCRAEDAYLQFFMEEAAEIAYEEAEAARGELAYCPDQMECYDCGRGSIAAAAAAGLNRRVVLPYPLAVGSLGLPYVMRTVIALGPIAEAHRDPTSTYKLTCSHYAM